MKKRMVFALCLNTGLDSWLCKNKGSVPGLLSQLTLDAGAASLGCSNPTGEWHLFNLLETESPLTLSDARSSMLRAPAWIPPRYTDKGQYLKENQGIQNELKVLSLPPTLFEISSQLHPLSESSPVFLASAFVRVGIFSLSRLSCGYINSVPQHKHCIKT